MKRKLVGRRRWRRTARRSLAVLAGMLLAALVPILHPPEALGAPKPLLQKIGIAPSGGTGASRVVSTSLNTTHFGLSWTGDVTAAFTVRWADATGNWSAPQTLAADGDLADPANRHGYSTLRRADGARSFVIDSVDKPVSDVKLSVIDAEHGPRQKVRLSSEPIAAGFVGAPAIITRAQWGADESIRKGTPSFTGVVKFVTHYTEGTNDDPDPAGTVRAIYIFHVQTRGYNDIAYHYLIDEQGRVYEGRWARDYGPGDVHDEEDTSGRIVLGAHALSFNDDTMGVALMGSFNSTEPRPAAVQALEYLYAWKAGEHGIDPLGGGVLNGRDLPNILGHRDVDSTDCPGDLLYAHLDAIRVSTASILAAANGKTPGYRTATGAGRVFSFGAARDFGDVGGVPLQRPVVGVANTPGGQGYWMVASDGGIFSFGDAQFHGSTGDVRLNQSIVGMAATPSGQGYWMVASDGGIFSFGDARFFGSTGGIRLNQTIVGMAATPSGHGYWLVATDGGIFTFGDALFFGSTGSVRLNRPVTGMAAANDGSGYWLVASDGGIFTFGTAAYFGGLPALRVTPAAPMVAIRATGSRGGYYMLGADGGVFTFGDALFHGAVSGLPGSNPGVDISLLPDLP